MVTEYVMTKEQVESQIDQAIHDPQTWNDEARWSKDAEYNKLVDSGVNKELAKQMLANEAAVSGGTSAALVSTILGAPLQKYFARIGLDEAASRAGAALKTGASEAGVNAVQEAQEQLWQNAEQRRFDPDHPITD